MAFTSLGALVATAAALPVPGLNKQVAFRPRQINAADLPLLYTRLPGSTRTTATLSYGQGLRTGTIEIVILVQMLNLNQQSANDALTVYLLDNLSITLQEHAEALGMDSYTLATEEDTIGEERSVQAIVATVEVSGGGDWQLTGLDFHYPAHSMYAALV